MQLSRSVYAAKRILSIIGCANDLAGRLPGTQYAPATLRKSEILKASRIAHRWENIIQQKVCEPPQRHLHALRKVYDYCNALAISAKKVVLREKDLLVIGGDHSCAIGTWSGVAKAIQHRGRLGLIWVDAHLDAHIPTTSHSGNIHGMPVAHLLGYGDARLSGLMGMAPKIHPKNLVMVGARIYENEEKDLLDKLEVRIIHTEEIEQRGLKSVMQEAVKIASDGTQGYGMSIDLDAFRVQDAPGVSLPDGKICADEFLRSISSLDLRRLSALEIAEFLPELDSTEGTTEKLVVALITEVYTNKWKQQRKGRGSCRGVSQGQ